MATTADTSWYAVNGVLPASQKANVKALLITTGANLEVVVGEVTLRRDCRHATGNDLS